MPRVPPRCGSPVDIMALTATLELLTLPGTPPPPPSTPPPPAARRRDDPFALCMLPGVIDLYTGEFYARTAERSGSCDICQLPKINCLGGLSCLAAAPLCPKYMQDGVLDLSTGEFYARTSQRGVSCDSCRERKANCSGGPNCSRCKNKGLCCTFHGSDERHCPAYPY